MSPLRIVAVVLIAGGILALVYRSFTYDAGTHDVDLGVVELSTTDRETVNVPAWAGAGAIVTGAALLFLRKPA